MLSLIYVALILIGLYIFLRRGERKGTVLPGPNGVPFIGVGFKVTIQNMFFKFSEYAQQYGDIFKLTLFGNTFVVLTSAELIRKAFSTEPYNKFMNDRIRTFVTDKFQYGNQGLPFAEHAYGSNHLNLRKGFARAIGFYGEGKKEFEDLVHAELCYLTEKLDVLGSKEFDLQDILRRSLNSILSILLSGQRLKTEEALQAISYYQDTGHFFVNPKVDVLLRTFPFLVKIPSVYKHRYDERVKAKNALMQVYFDDIKASHKEGVVRGIVDFMIEEQVQAKKNEEEVLYTDERIKSAIIDAIQAAVLTTLSHLTSVFLCLMNHPEYQVRVQEEIDSVIGNKRRPTLHDRAKCPLLEAVTLEAHRHLPAAPGLLPHQCKSNIEFEGFDIPKNSIIIPDIFHVQHDEKVWGDPWQFRPERFLDDNGDVVGHDHPFRKSLLPFGIGRRQCVGESLARSRTFLFVTTLLQRFTFELPPGEHVSCDPRYGNFDWKSSFQHYPFKCTAKPRVLKK